MSRQICPVAWRLTNTSFRRPIFEYFETKEAAERRQFNFNRSVDDGGLYNLTPLYSAEQVQQLQADVDRLTDERDKARIEARIGGKVEND